jgi:phospholipase C
VTKKALESVKWLLSRRRALQGSGALLGTSVACGSDDVASADGTTGESSTGGSGDGQPQPMDGDGSSSSGAPADGTGDADDSTSAGSSTSDGEAESGSEDSSTGEPVDLTPEELLANIDHIIVLCMENRSFDHYLGALQLAEGVADVAGLDGTETNPDAQGNPVAVFEMDNFEPEDPPHGWDACHQQWNEGANDGFVIAHAESAGAAVAHEVMGYHVRNHLPVTYALADAYTVCDQWFCSLLSQTWPNRYYLWACDSSGSTNNTPASPGPTTILSLCADHDVSSHNYYDGLAAWKWGAYPITGFAGTSGIGSLFDKLASGSGLESVVIIDPDFLSNDDHPSHNIQLGQALIGSIYTALANSQYWERSLLIITYDEHGGFFDHVPPPTTVDDNGPEFAQMGFRVPTLVIGPHVRVGAIDHTVYEHSSFAATVARRFGLPPLNQRMAATADVSSCIDPALVDNPQPPVPVPQLVLRESEILAGLGDVTSQPELFEAVGIPVPLRGEHREQHRRSVERLLAEAERLGVAKVIRDVTGAGRDRD